MGNNDDKEFRVMVFNLGRLLFNLLVIVAVVHFDSAYIQAEWNSWLFYVALIIGLTWFNPMLYTISFADAYGDAQDARSKDAKKDS